MIYARHDIYLIVRTLFLSSRSSSSEEEISEHIILLIYHKLWYFDGIWCQLSPPLNPVLASNTQFVPFNYRDVETSMFSTCSFSFMLWIPFPETTIRKMDREPLVQSNTLKMSSTVTTAWTPDYRDRVLIALNSHISNSITAQNELWARVQSNSPMLCSFHQGGGTS